MLTLLRLARTIALYAPPLVSLAWLLGSAFRDRWWLTTLGFYLPPLAIVAMAAGWMVVCRKRAASWQNWTVAAIGLAALTKTLAVDFAWQKSYGRRAGSSRVIHWNIAHAPFGMDPVLETLSADRPEIVLLSECPDPGRPATLAERLFDNGAVHYASGMSLISTWQIVETHDVDLPRARGWWARLANPGRVLDVLAVDLKSDPRRSRRAQLEGITEWVGRHDERIPLLVLGDFNTPRDSSHFEPLRGQLYHGYERRGRGWPYTWPVPVPLWSIDHAWCSRRIRLWNYRLRYNRYSDHARQILDITVVLPRTW